MNTITIDDREDWDAYDEESEDHDQLPVRTQVGRIREDGNFGCGAGPSKAARALRRAPACFVSVSHHDGKNTA